MSLFGDTKLARRLEQNAALEMVAYAETMARLGLSPEARVKPVADGYAVISGKHLPINRIGGLGMSGTVSAANLEQVEAFYREAGLPAQVDLCPLADPSLMQILGERGYRVFRFYSVLVRPLTEADAIPQAGEVAVVQVGQEQEQDWMRVVSQGFNGRDDLATKDNNFILTRTVLNREDTRCFLAKVGDEPAGGGALGIRNGLATLYSASTRASFRRRGVQKALIEVRLAAAFRAGCDLATVLTTPGSDSQRNMQRHGFQLIYTRPMLIKD